MRRRTSLCLSLLAVLSLSLSRGADAQQFQQATAFPGPQAWTEGVECADVDHDGDLDVFFAEGDGFDITTGVDAVLHGEDVAPLPIAAGPQGSAVVATPTVSLFQSDLIALRLIVDATWGLRAAGKTALVTGLTW